jgi:hypothetical protein
VTARLPAEPARPEGGSHRRTDTALPAGQGPT